MIIKSSIIQKGIGNNCYYYNEGIIANINQGNKEVKSFLFITQLHLLKPC